MSTPLRNDEQGLSRREELTVSTAAMADVPWAVAGAAGVVVTGADLLLHLMGGNRLRALRHSQQRAPRRSLHGPVARRDRLRPDRRGRRHRGERQGRHEAQRRLLAGGRSAAQPPVAARSRQPPAAERRGNR